MNKAYNPINWVNNETPINETNLNKMSNGLSAVDDRVIALNKTLGSYSDKINEALEASVVAQDAKEIALESAEKAEEALKNAEAVVGVGIATKDKAGLVKGGDVFIAEDGTLKFIEKTTSTTMLNSHKGRLMFDEIGGRCEQLTTTGYNLLDLSDAKNGTSSGITVIMNSDGSYSYTGTATNTAVNVWLLGNWNITDVLFTLPAGTYYIQGVNLYNGTAPLVRNYGNNGQLVTFSVDTNVTGVQVAQAVLNETYNETIYPMIAKSDVELPWEPYTGGIPSPNPSYPMEIKKSVVGEIKTHGKNFLDCRGLTELTLNGVTFTPVYDSDNNLLYVEANGTATGQASFIMMHSFMMHSLKNGMRYILSGCPKDGSNSTYRMQVWRYDGSGTVADTGGGVEFVFNDTTGSSNVAIVIFEGYTAHNLRFYPMIREASVDDDTYEPYTESSITLSQPIDLYGIGDEQDIMDAKKIEWRFKYRRLTSADNWRLGNGNWYLTSAISDMLVDTSFQVAHRVKAALCTHFVYEEDYGLLVNETNNGISMFKADYGYRTLVHDDRFSSLNEFTTWLDANEVYIAYQLATPTTESLPIADQIALNSLATYDGITYLEFDSEIEPTFKGEYGTSKVGGYTLEGLLTGRNAELLQQSNADRITALETALINNV